MKLDASVLRYLSREEFRVLTAIEMGMKNHRIVPTTLICRISNMKRGLAFKCIKELHKYKLITHEAKKYDGYKLNYSGYDYLALKTFVARGILSGVGNQIGVGKESDIFVALTDEGEQCCLKLHRLGRISFRTIKRNRDYLRHRKNASWMYLSRLAALKEYAFMCALHQYGFPVPKPIDQNRHAVVMGLVAGYPLCQVDELKHPGVVYQQLMNLIIRLAQHGLIHGDFNEFNLMIDDEENLTVIDFPQMVSTSHPNADMYFSRDVECVRTWFSRKYGYEGSEYPKFEDVVDDRIESLDIAVEASGFSREHQMEFEALLMEQGDATDVDDDDDDDDEDDDSDEEEEDDEEEGELEGQDFGPGLGLMVSDEEEDDDDHEEDEEEEGGGDGGGGLGGEDGREGGEAAVAQARREEILRRNRLENSKAGEGGSGREEGEEEDTEGAESSGEEGEDAEDGKAARGTALMTGNTPSKMEKRKQRRRKQREGLSEEEVRNKVRRQMQQQRKKGKFKSNEYKSRDKRKLRSIARDGDEF